ALRDADSDETLSLSSAHLGGIRYRILVGQANYQLEVTHSGSSSAEAFSVCLATESGSVICPEGSATTTVAEAAIAPTLIAGVPSQTPTFAPIAINPADACQITPARNNSVNVRGGAGTNFNIVGQIAANGTGLVVGRLADGSWYQVNANGATGWVSAGVVILGGNCSGVAVITLPTAIPPTNAPPVSVPTNTSGNPPPTEAPADVPPDNTPRLNPGGDAEYLVNLQGHATSPYWNYPVASIGADVDASYLGGGCAGLVSAPPTLYINLIDPLPGLLRFYFIHNDATDAVMIIQDPDGHIHCGDDSYGTVNPTIDLNGPSGGFPRTSPPSAGRYYIWVGSHSIPTIGTLYVTNSEDYHP
ncbi:MAG: SH3 domain-containing protein, partial [Chloroflexota bacterium]